MYFYSSFLIKNFFSSRIIDGGGAHLEVVVQLACLSTHTAFTFTFDVLRCLDFFKPRLFLVT